MKTNWPVKKLGEVCVFQGGTQPPKSTFVYELKDGYIRLLQIRDFITDRFATYVPISNKLRTCSSDDVLIGRYGASVGKILKGQVGAYNVAIMKAIPNDKELTKDYLFYYLKLPQVLEFILSLPKRSAQAGFTKEEIGQLEIPVPGIEEQKRIVAKLEKIFAKIDGAYILCQESSEEAQNIIRTKLGELFENNSWAETRVSDIAEKPQYGYTASSAKDKIGPRLLRITDIQNGMVDWENVPYCKCNEVDKYRLTSGDIVFTRTGATTGKSFLIKDTPEQTVFASYLIRLKTKGGIKQEFLYWFFQSPQYWDQIMGHQRGSAQPNVNAVTLSTIKLRMPENLKEQGKIVAYLDSLSEKVQKLQTLQQEQLEELEALQQSVLHQAFQGELAR